MNLQQAKELFTLITTVRHVEEMNLDNGVGHAITNDLYGCLLCESVRHGIYTKIKAKRLQFPEGFASYFGCLEDEADHVIYLWHLESRKATGENYFQAGKELLEKYGYGHLFESIKPKAMSFKGLMSELTGVEA